MNITDFYINGFGIFHDQSASNLASGVVLFQGHNEAGKSTLLGFIRSVFFGFPRANAKDAQYAPLAGGLHGGWIRLLISGGGEYTVSRKRGPGGGRTEVLGPGGTSCDKGILTQLLGGLSYEAFRNIYAFGLSELQSFETLKGESIAGAIYGAGIGDAMLGLPRAKKKIQEQLDLYFKPGGSKPVLNKTISELDHIDKAIKEAETQALDYDATVEALQQVEKAVAATQQALADHRRNWHRYGAMVRLWPEWVTLRESEAALCKMTAVPEGFPKDGLERVQALAEKRERLKDAAEEISLRIEKLQGRIRALTVNPELLGQAPRIALLLEKRSEYTHSIQQRFLLQQKIKSEETQIQQVIHTLGPDWTKERICAVDPSLFTREAARQYREQLQDTRKDFSAAEKILADKGMALDHANRDLEQAEKALAALGHPPDKRDPALILQVKQGRDRFADAIHETHRINEALHQSGQAIERLREETEASRRGIIGCFNKMAMSPWWLILVILGGVAATGLTSFYQKGGDAPVIVAAGAVMAQLAAWGYRQYRRRIDLYQTEKMAAQQENKEAFEQHQARLQILLASYGTTAARALGVPEEGLPSGQALLTEVDRFIAVLPEEDRQRETYHRAEEFVNRKREETNTAQEDWEVAGRRLKVLEGQRDQQNAAWREWLVEQGLPESLSADTTMEALDGIQRATEAMSRREQFIEELEGVDERIGAYRRLFDQTVGELNLPRPKEALMVQVVDDLVRELDKARGNDIERTLFQKQLNTQQWEKSEADEKIKANNEKLHSLLSEAGMDDEERFIKTATAMQERHRLITLINQCRNNIQRILGEADSKGLREELSSLSLTDVKMKEDERAGLIQTLDGELASLLAKQAKLRQTLEKLATSDDILQLRSEEAALVTALEDSAQEWARWALADYLVDFVTASFEKKHQPHIIQDAGGIFSQMTGGRYTGLLAPLGENTILAVNDRGQQIPPQALSRGTAEQLYLAVRFGYIRHRAKTGEPLPVVMDDILVNFDPKRARQAAETISALSATHQVLYFTCHPETVALFKEINKNLAVYRLRAGSIQAEEVVG